MKYLTKIVDFFIKNDISGIQNKEYYKYGMPHAYFVKEDKIVPVGSWHSDRTMGKSKLTLMRRYSIEEVLLWRDVEPYSFPIYFDSDRTLSKEIIDLTIFCREVYNSVNNNRIDIIGMMVESDYIKVYLLEDGFEKGDGMPDDIIKDYIQSIKLKLESRKKYYLDNYNILSSRNTSQKMKYRVSDLFSLRLGGAFTKDTINGTFTIGISAKL